MAASEYNCLVKYNRMISPTVFELGFETDKPFDFDGGQFISVIIPGAGPNGRDLRRAYSIASAPEKRPIELCIKLVEGGPGTNYLYKLKEGDRFRGYAPYGDFVYEAKCGRHALFIATGTGVAPFRSMLLSEKFRANLPASAICLMGVRTEDEVVYDAEMGRVANVKWIPAVSRPNGTWQGFTGRVTEYLRTLGADFPWTETEYYICGNGAMITEVKAILTEKGVAKECIHQEKYY